MIGMRGTSLTDNTGSRMGGGHRVPPVRRCAVRPQSTHRRAFTLVELLVVVSILGVVTGVVGASLAAGIRVWQAARTFGTAEAQALVGMRILRRDVMNAFTFYAIPYEGTPQSMSFPATVNVQPEDGPPVRRLGSVAYRYNRDARTLERQVRLFATEAAVPDMAVEHLLRGVERVDIRYGELSEKGLTWEAEWDNTTNHPEVVEIQLAIATDREPLVIRETIVAAVQTLEKKK